MAVFQPPNSQSTLSGWFMRSEANFRLRECQPLPGFGSSPARFSALFHQTDASAEPTHLEGYFGEGDLTP